MALVICPECGKELSDKAESCPGCGYVLWNNGLSKTGKSKLSERETSPTMGAIYIFCGILAVVFGIFTVVIIIGIFAIIGGSALIGIGVGHISGMQKGLCPYCNQSVSVRATATTCKCTHCKKISSKKGDVLETIE